VVEQRSLDRVAHAIADACDALGDLGRAHTHNQPGAWDAACAGFHAARRRAGHALEQARRIHGASPGCVELAAEVALLRWIEPPPRPDGIRRVARESALEAARQRGARFDEIRRILAGLGAADRASLARRIRRPAAGDRLARWLGSRTQCAAILARLERARSNSETSRASSGQAPDGVQSREPG
jgi:hypothetical protein